MAPKFSPLGPYNINFRIIVVVAVVVAAIVIVIVVVYFRCICYYIYNHKK